MLVLHPDYGRFVNAPGHVESPERLEAIRETLESLDLLGTPLVPEPVTRPQIEATHSRDYVDLVESFGEGYLDVDTAIRPDTFRYACLAAGGAVAAALEAAEAGHPMFALVRPPGHHAGPDYGGGFCYLNNVAIAANALRPRFPRVAVLDYDAHHGNGSQDIFAESPDVLYVSTHQSGIFPGTGPAEYMGEGPGEGFTVNLPFPAGAGDATYERAFQEVIEPVVRQFHPEAILVSLGVDAHYKDPLTALVLSSPGYAWLAEQTLRLASSSAQGRIAFVLEGGYHRAALAEVIAAMIAGFRGESIDLQFRDVRDRSTRGAEAVERTRKVHEARWDL